ncbi:MAG: hypothetical protein HYX75_14100 [Acidobacteria bacterium]|nr:hypothetical protein [Acidobacteriota bacterium]
MTRQKKSEGPREGKEREAEEESLRAEAENFLRLKEPVVPEILDNVLLVFANSIPEDARPQCTIASMKAAYQPDADETAKRTFLLKFVRERLVMVSQREYGLWLNGRLPFITPRELLLWRMRQYVEYIWAFQLPDDDDLALIFNTTKLRASYMASDFIARFRKALLFPIALRRIYRILRGLDPVHRMIEREYELNRAYGPIFRVPSRRYLLDANSLIEELRLREKVPLRDAALISKTDNTLWVHKNVVDVVKDNKIRDELFSIYEIPSEAGYEG